MLLILQPLFFFSVKLVFEVFMQYFGAAAGGFKTTKLAGGSVSLRKAAEIPRCKFQMRVDS